MRKCLWACCVLECIGIRKMKHPVAPFLETNFYFADIPDEIAFMHVLRALASVGARFTGHGTVRCGVGTDHVREEFATINSLQDADACVAAGNRHLVQVSMADASAAQRGGGEIVAFQSISEEAAVTDHHPIAIWSSGPLFSGPLDKRERRERRQLGAKMYRRFLDLIRKLEPSYAAFTVESPLECPTDLRRDPRSYAFNDFYVDANFLGASRTERVLALFPDAYREPVAKGWYISCWGDFNPKHIQVDRTANGSASSAVAAIIATTARSSFDQARNWQT